MSNNILKIAAFCIAVVMILSLAVFANALVGNPLSKALAKQTARAHLAENYANTDYQIESVSFDFKNTDYYAKIKSPTSIDGDFMLHIDMYGNIIYDDYESRVTNKGNTADRINTGYRALVAGVIDTPAYPFEVFIGFGEIVFEYEVGVAPAPDAIKMSELELDRFYDIAKIGETSGYITIYIYTGDVNAQYAAQILLKTKRQLDDAGVGFRAISLTLQHPKPLPGDKKEWQSDTVTLLRFAYSDIYEEGLTDRVSAADRAAKEYYAEMDAHQKD